MSPAPKPQEPLWPLLALAVTLALLLPLTYGLSEALVALGCVSESPGDYPSH